MHPTLLDRYMSKRLWDYFVLALLIFTLVMFFSDALLDFMKDLQHYGIPGDIALTLIGLQLPAIVSRVLPLAALLATLLVYHNMNNAFELIAMRMSGISLYRLAKPAFILGLSSAVLAFMLHDYVVPLCNKYARGLKTFAFTQQNLPATEENFTYKQFDDNQRLKRLLYVSHFHHKKLGYSTVIDLSNPDTLQVIQARAGQWGNQSIVLENASIYTVSSNQKLSNTTSADHLELQNLIQPQGMVSEYHPKELSFLGLWQWIEQEKRKGEKFSPEVYVTLWQKLTMPFAALPLALLAVPLSIAPPRRLNNAGYIAAIVIWFGYYIVFHIMEQFGKHGTLPAWIAAIIPLILITVITAILFYRKNKTL